MKKRVLLFAFTIGICLSTGLHAQEQPIESEGISFRVTELKQIGNHLMLKMLITSTDEEKTIQIRNKQAKVIDSANNVYTSVYKSRIGESIGNGAYGQASSKLDAGVAVKAYIIFKGTVAKKEKINRIELPVDILDDQKTVNVSFPDLTVPYYSSEKSFAKSNKHLEVADKVFLKINSVKKKEDKLIVNYVLTNENAKKPICPMVNNTHLIDSRGNSYLCKKASLGDKSGGKYRNLRTMLEKGATLEGAYIFESSKIKNMQKIKLLHLNIDKNSFKAKDIDITQ